MSRRALAPIFLLLAAAASIAAVFGVQRIESRGGPLSQPWATPYFSPNGDGEADVADIRFTTRQAEVVTVEVVDVDGDRVRLLAERVAVDGATSIPWDGQDDDGKPVSDGTYRVRITRAGDDRAYSPTRATVVDTIAPVGRLDRWSWEAGELRGLALLEPDARLEAFGSSDAPLTGLRAFRANPRARSAQPEGPGLANTIPVRFTVAVDRDVVEAEIVGLDAVDRAGNRSDLLEPDDVPEIQVLDD